MKDAKTTVKRKVKKTPPKKQIITNLIPDNKPIMCCFGFKPQPQEVIVPVI